MKGCQAKDETEGHEATSGSKRCVVVNPLDLVKALDTQAGFVLEELAVGVKLLLEDPGGVKGLGAGCEGCHYPDLMLLDVVKLKLNSHEPMGLIKEAKILAVSVWVLHGCRLANNEIGLVATDDKGPPTPRPVDDVGRVDGGADVLRSPVKVRDEGIAPGGRVFLVGGARQLRRGGWNGRGGNGYGRGIF
jgi:hypothetical protein